MRKIIFLSFFLFTVLSCTKDEKDLKLELLTNEIVCVENINKHDYFEAFYQPNKVYDSLSKNIIHYKITNISDKKYFIMLNQNNLGTVERDFYRESLGKKKFSTNEIGFSLYKNDSVLDGNSTKVENMCGNGLELLKVEELNHIIKDFLVKNKINNTYELSI
ncbi:hypothetical protein [Flavobacterium reichenbachii]|uniref:Lipoprotein n=1 Tax=Flavobacterium reichenbachii TaxID=362418 RepID=A0A085ZJQ6_9FLAO|nr:hypothetical protein [Flavobacterium reichenbachii]KFF04670.1 hypothetical protein IW19_03595 [Flavobacterium reichenbachii]OXB09865.1 hypothetical protein B0A68_23275 [Flavobacterium reichenbachii]